MISTLEKVVTLRFLKTRKKDGFLNVISIFSFIGISLGVAVLIIVMSVMNGFRTELINKIIGFNSHITVKPYETSINLDKINESKLKNNELVYIGDSFSDKEAADNNNVYFIGIDSENFFNSKTPTIKDFKSLEVFIDGIDNL